MEEFIGKLWHRGISQRAVQDYPDAAVCLDDIQTSIAIFFRAMGGEGGLRVEEATESDNFARRGLMQRIAGSGKKNSFAWRDEETLRLPRRIALFDKPTLNRDLYHWLAAISAIELVPRFWLESNLARTRQTLDIWPGLLPLYTRLVDAHLQQRPKLIESDTVQNKSGLTTGEISQELTIQAALRSPYTEASFSIAAKHAPQAVPLWLHPSPPELLDMQNWPLNDPDQLESEQKKAPPKAGKRKQASRTEMPDEKGGLMSFRLESLWSWTEYIKVDRSGTESDDDDAAKTAEDMDNITVATDAQTASSKIKLDLDLPSAEYDDIALGEGIPIDEWDYKTQRMQKAHCRLQLMVAKDANNSQLPAGLAHQARRVRRQFEMLRPQRQWVSRQMDGTELDLDGFINYLGERQSRQVNSEQPVYRQSQYLNRDLSCLLLDDLSLSTEAYVNNETRVIDVIRDSLFLFAEALSATGDRFALHGFSSRNRGHVRFYNIKGFDDDYDEASKGHINAVKPGYYTRMGAAIRHATSLLAVEPSSQKLLLLLTDGKPNDLDKYEGRYGIEDTRKAVLEAEQKGVRPFCVTIDQEAEDYLPYLFGKQSYVFMRDAKDLPNKLPQLYLRLTR